MSTFIHVTLAPQPDGYGGSTPVHEVHVNVAHIVKVDEVGRGSKRTTRLHLGGSGALEVLLVQQSVGEILIDANR